MYQIYLSVYVYVRSLITYVYTPTCIFKLEAARRRTAKLLMVQVMFGTPYPSSVA